MTKADQSRLEAYEGLAHRNQEIEIDLKAVKMLIVMAEHEKRDITAAELRRAIKWRKK